MRYILPALLLCCLLAEDAPAAERVSDAEHGFSLVVPDGFAESPEAKGPAGSLGAYMRGRPDDGSFAIVQLQSLGGTIGRDALVRDVVEKSAREAAQKGGVEIADFEYRKTTWKGFELEVTVARMNAGEQKLVSLATQVPLVKQAVQVQIFGPAADEAKLSADLDAFLAGIDGKSNWLTEDEKSQKISSLIGSGVGVLLGLGLVLWWKRRRKTA